MRNILSTLLFSLLPAAAALCQGQPEAYYLPDISYNPAVPSPSQFFGFQMGAWHLSHDQVLSYMKALDAASDRVALQEHGRTHEHRPLVHLLITSPGNHGKLPAIREEHLRLSDPESSAELDLSGMPLVLYQGFTIHGNEPSGVNAAVLVAYYLAAGESPAIRQLLDNTVIVFDPVFNPDGMQRFANWVNMNKNKVLTDDNADREYDEPWPRGRTNHYWFDLNRDWLPAQHPESQGRVKLFQDWRPNILTDHHEMGTNSTFFFMPGVQSRVNPITPRKNQELTFQIGTFHARALDKIRSLYYTQESFDDFYYGKGSTYPDAQGCIGILFEQASSRGHVQQTPNGPITFAFTIRNQVQVALSTHEAALALRGELLAYQRDFYRDALKEAAKDQRKAFLVGDKHDKARLLKFAEMALRHQVEIYELKKSTNIGGNEYEPGQALVIPLEQAQYKLVLGMFQRDTIFTDSIFYDISAWTLPLAFGLQYGELSSREYTLDLLGNRIQEASLPEGSVLGASGDYAFAFDWDSYLAPAALYYLMKKGVNLKVATQPFTGATSTGQRQFSYGAIVVGTQHQPFGQEQLYQVLQEAARLGHLDIHGLQTGLTSQGIDLGSNQMQELRLPRVLLLTGDDVTSYDAGEIWHLLDTRYQIPVTKVETGKVTPAVLNRFNVVIMADGTYDRLNAEVLRNWVNAGGTLVSYKRAINWLEGKQLTTAAFKKAPEPGGSTARRSYAGARESQDALELSGAIFEAELDVTHPLCYGYRSSTLPVFRDSDQFLEPARNPYSAPVIYRQQKPLMAGYVHRTFKPMAPGSPSVIVSGTGEGKVICMSDNTNFRAFWYGTNKLLANAIFFGNTVSKLGVEKSVKKD